MPAFCDADKAGGLRFQARASETSSSACWPGYLKVWAIVLSSTEILQDLMLGVEAPGNPIGLKPIPIEDYREFLRLKLRGTINGKTYSGMRDAGRNAENEEQMKEAELTYPDIAKNISMASDPIPQELLIEQKVGFYTRKAEKGGKKYVVFQFLLPYSTGKKGNTLFLAPFEKMRRQSHGAMGR